MPVILNDSKVLLDDSKVATSEDCCCEECDCEFPTILASVEISGMCGPSTISGSGSWSSTGFVFCPSGSLEATTDIIVLCEGVPLLPQPATVLLYRSCPYPTLGEWCLRVGIGPFVTCLGTPCGLDAITQNIPDPPDGTYILTLTSPVGATITWTITVIC